VAGALEQRRTVLLIRGGSFGLVDRSGQRVRPSGVQFAGFPDTRQRIAHPTPKPSFRAITRTDVSCSHRSKDPVGKAFLNTSIGEVGKKAFPAGADGKHEHVILIDHI